MTQSQKIIIGMLFVAFLLPIGLLVVGLNFWDETNDNTLTELESELLPVSLKYDKNYFEKKITGNPEDGVNVMFENRANSSRIYFFFPNFCFQAGANLDVDLKSQLNSLRKASIGKNSWLSTIKEGWQLGARLRESSFNRDKRGWIQETYEMEGGDSDLKGEFILGGIVSKLGAKKNHLVEGVVFPYNLRGCAFGVITTYPKIMDKNKMNVFMKRQADLFYLLESKIYQN